MLRAYQGIGRGKLVRILTKDKDILSLLKQLDKEEAIPGALGSNDYEVDVIIASASDFFEEIASLLPRMEARYTPVQFFVLKKTLLLYGRKNNVFILFDKSKKKLFNLCKSYISFVISFLLEFNGFFLIHGNSIVTDLGGILITGKTSTGKSTLLSNLVSSGNFRLTDHYGVLYKRCSTVRVLSLFQLLDAFGLSHIDCSVFYKGSKNTDFFDFTADELLDSEGYEAKIILFPEISKCKKSRICKLSKIDALKRLIAFSSASFHGNNAQVKKCQLDLLVDLSRQCDSFHFLSGRNIIEDDNFRSYDFLKKELSAH